MARDEWDDNGGPAYPAQDGDFYWPGMRLRDYFAAQALTSIVATYVQGNGMCVGTDHFPRNVAAHAYALADAMMKARKP